MLVVITNVSDTAYSANHVNIPAHGSVFIPDHHLNDVQWNGHGQMTYLSTTQNWYFPFAVGANGTVPSFNHDSDSAQSRLYVGLYDSLNAFISQANAKITNDPNNTFNL